MVLPNEVRTAGERGWCHMGVHVVNFGGKLSPRRLNSVVTIYSHTGPRSHCVLLPDLACDAAFNMARVASRIDSMTVSYLTPGPKMMSSAVSVAESSRWDLLA